MMTRLGIVAALLLTLAGTTTHAASFPGEVPVSDTGPSSPVRIVASGASDPDSRQVPMGDINGDGRSDIAVSSVVGGSAAFFRVYLGGIDDATGQGRFPADDLLDGSTGFLLSSPTPSVRIGPAGDLNADGIDDWLVYRYRPDRAWLVFGRSDGYPARLDVNSLASMPGVDVLYDAGDLSAQAFRAPSAVNDITGDGIDDLLLLRGNQRIEALVLAGRPTLGGDLPDPLALPRLWQGDVYLDSVSVVGLDDISGDGIGEVGFYSATHTGGASVVFGGQPALSLDGALSNLDGSNGFTITQWIDTIASIDIDSDGRAEFLACFRSGPLAIYPATGVWPAVLPGSVVDETDTGPRQVLAVPNNTEVGRAGDINGDGLQDWFLAYPYHSINGEFAGRVDVLFGSNRGVSDIDLDALDGRRGLTVYGSGDRQFLGRDTAAAGDVTGDGVDDLFLGNVVITHDEATTLSGAWLVGLVADAAAPPSVRNLSVSLGVGLNALDWDNPVDADIDHVRIERDGVLLQEVDADVRHVLDTDVVPGSEYRYAVVVVDSEGRASASVETIVTNTLTDAPVLRGAVYGVGVYELFWAGGDNDVYRLYRDQQLVYEGDAQSLMQYPGTAESHRWYIESYSPAVAPDFVEARVRSADLVFPADTQGTTAIIPPAKPGGFQADVYARDLVEVSWQRDTRATPPVVYEIASAGMILGRTDGTSYLDSREGIAEQTVSYTVTAIGADGTRASSSFTDSLWPKYLALLPRVVKRLTTRPGEQSGDVWLDWTTSDVGVPVAAYRVWLDGEFIATTTDNSLLLNGLDPDRRYSVNVQSIGLDGTPSPMPYRDWIFITDGGPLPPTAVRALAYGPRLIEILWDRSAGTTFVPRYEIYRNGEALAISSGSSYLDTAVEPGASYRYEVRALGGTSSSPSVFSDVATVMTPVN